MHSWRNTLLTGFLLMLMIAFMGVCVQLCLVANPQVNEEVCLQPLPVDLTPTAIRPTLSTQKLFSVYVANSGFNPSMNTCLIGQIFEKQYHHQSAASQIPIFLTHCVLRI